MKRFLHGRLHDRQRGYRFYIPTSHPIGDLSETIARADIEDGERGLFLQSLGGHVTFGIKERLNLKDDFGRWRYNFMGYQPEAGERVPFLDGLQGVFDEITAEAHECHHILDQNWDAGKSMQDTAIIFSRGSFQSGNDWDQAISELSQKPSASFLKTFDKNGKLLSSSVAAPEIVPDTGGRSTSVPPADTGPTRKSTGIRSDAKLPQEQRTVVPPLPPMEDRPISSSFFREIWRGAVDAVADVVRPRSKRKKPNDKPSNNPFDNDLK
jgi:hypothetical protein